jgi:hypothetical protein
MDILRKGMLWEAADSEGRSGNSSMPAEVIKEFSIRTND